jgi:hypothetical protein
MRTTGRAIYAASLLLASILASSCDNSYSVFKSIEGEKKQNGTKVFQETTATNAFRLNNTYYASTGRLYSHAVMTPVNDGNAWNQVNIGGHSSYTLRSVVLVSSTTPTIYALIETGTESASGSTGSYGTGVTVSLYSSTDGSTWTQIATPAVPSPLPASGSYTFLLDALFTANGQLYAEGNLAINTGGQYPASYFYLYYFNSASFQPVTPGSATTNAFFPTYQYSSSGNVTTCSIRGVGYDTNTSNYWFAASNGTSSGPYNELYSGTSADGSNAISVLGSFNFLDSNTIWQISSAGSYVYIATTTGYLYQSGTATRDSVSSNPLTCVVQVPSSSGNILLVGSDVVNSSYSPTGYYEGTFNNLVSGSTNSIVSSTSSIFSTTVGIFPVHAFYYDSSTGNLFCCISPGDTSTSYYGLYVSNWNGSSWSGWSAQ